MKVRIVLGTVVLAVAALFIAVDSVAQDFDQPYGIESLNDIDNVAPIRQQILKEEEWLRWRKKHIVPEVMRRAGVDLWLIGRNGRDRNARALYYSLVPANYEGLVAPQYDVLIFHDQGDGEGIEEFAVDMDEVADIVERCDPEKIGVSEDSRERFTEALGSGMASRFVSSRDLSTGFLEKRSPEEISVFHHVARVAYDIIVEAFSNKVVVPDVTTLDDLNWWILQRYRDLGLDTSDYPTITVQRSKLERPKYAEGDEHFDITVSPRNGYNKIIRRGDILSCDTGIIYYGLGTDTQQNAYVLKEGETDVPEGLKTALDNTNRFQNHIAEAFKVGRPANDCVIDALKAAWADGLRPSLYGHPLPYYLMRYNSPGALIKIRYGAGPDIRSGGSSLLEPNRLPSPGGYPLYANTTYALELHTWTSVPEWGGQDVRINEEQNVAMTENGLIFLGGRQTEWYVIK